jgi:proline iminopeptidase
VSHIHGRPNLGGPLQTAWDLHHAWPDSTLTVIESAVHLGTTETRKHVLRALNRFAVNDAIGM